MEYLQQSVINSTSLHPVNNRRPISRSIISSLFLTSCIQQVFHVLSAYFNASLLLVQSCCVGVCIPEEAMLRALAEEEQVPNAGKLTFSQLCSNLKVVSAVLNRLTEHAVKNKLTGLERVSTTTFFNML